MSLNTRSVVRWGMLVLFGGLILAAVPSGRTQPPLPPGVGIGLRGGDRAADVIDLRSTALPEFTGYTRPGRPADREGPGGKIILAADENPRDAIGGTVYFTVLEQRRNAEVGDTWGTGIKNFDALLVRGREVDGASSPRIDTTARYLYLYQTINDRGTGVPITSTSIRLLVDPRAITSWGSAPGLGFAAPPREWQRQTTVGLRAAAFGGEGGGVRPAVQDDFPKDQVRPVSYDVTYTSAVQGENRLYKDPAPAVTGKEIPVLAQLPTTTDLPARARTPIIGAALEVALDPVQAPDYVVLDYGRDALRDSGQPYLDRPYVRAVWNSRNGLKRGERSTVYGFTSNLPPTMAGVLVRGPAEKEKAGPKAPGGQKPPVRPADQGEVSQTSLVYFQQPAAGSGVVPAAGTVPTPTPAAAPGAAIGGLGFGAPFGGLGGFPGGAGAGGGFGAGGAVGGFGSAPNGGGGGFGGGSGGGTGGGTGGGFSGFGGANGQQGQLGALGQQQQQQQIPSNMIPVINLNLQQNLSQQTSVNQSQSQAQAQSQKQSQKQSQNQNQKQNQNQNQNSQIVPEPAAFIMAATGLPFLYAILRRRRTPFDTPA
jgi:hypothetical protein